MSEQNEDRLILCSLLSRRQKLLDIKNRMERSKFPKKQSDNSSASVIENTDSESENQLPTKNVKGPNVVINTSNESSAVDDGNINTSTVSLHRSHSFFTGNIENTGTDSARIGEIRPMSDFTDITTVIPDLPSDLNDLSDTIIGSFQKDCDIHVNPSISAEVTTAQSPLESQSRTTQCVLDNVDHDSNFVVTTLILEEQQGSRKHNLDNNNISLKSSSEDEHTGKDKTNNKRKRHQTSNFTKSCMDFYLEDDIMLQDFSSGSSDLWSDKEDSSHCSDNIEKNKKRRVTKKKNTPKESVPIQKKERPSNKSKTRKNLKEKGLPYQTASGVDKEARKLQDNPCQENKCPRECYKITNERRQSIFDYFWSLNDERKRDWIVRCFKSVPIKRKKTKNIESKRSVTYEYFINEGEDRRQVCQQFIIKTLDISQTYLLYNINNAEEGMSRKDRRQRTATDKYDENTKVFAKNYIQSLPALPSHYSRKKSNKVYLPEEFKNVTNLYRLYVKYCREKSENYLSEKLFTNIFKEYNICFHIPKKDKCGFCTKKENNPDEISSAEIDQHNTEKEATYKRFHIHQNLKPDNTIITASFDLQKVLGTPHGDSMMLYYSRKYAVYNFTVYENRTQKGYCYTWGEASGKRGSCEIATCLFRYLQEVDNRGVKKLLLYCDNCAGQNKNKVVLSLFKHFLEQSQNLEVIQVNFLLAGHTYMPVDSMHAVIEREIKRLIVWAPSQWATFMESARKRPEPYNVNVLEYQDFTDYSSLAEKVFTPGTLKNKDLRFKDIRVCTFKKNDLTKVDVKYTMAENGENYEIKLSQEESEKGKGRKAIKRTTKGKGKGKSSNKIDETAASGFPQLYKERLPISLAKYKDLKKLCDSGVIPNRFHNEYFNLPYKAQIQDVLQETDDNESD